MKKKLLMLALSIILLFFSVNKKSIKAVKIDDIPGDAPPLNIKAKAAILMEVTTKQVLLSYNTDQIMPPASMTKVMTMKLVLDAIRDNKITMDTIVETSEHASSMGGSQIFLAPYEKMKVKDLFKSMVIASANDAAVSLAEAVSGSEENFVKLMNHTALTIGCKNTNFTNATGLPDSKHHTTCYDMALMASFLLEEYENEIIPYTSSYEGYVREDTSNPFWLVNTNKLIKNGVVDGLKTGWTEEAGYCLTATMKKDGMRLVSVVMGEQNTKIRNSDTMSILSNGYSLYELKVLKPKGSVITKNIDYLVTPSTYEIVNTLDITKVTTKGEKEKQYDEKIFIDYEKIRIGEDIIIGRIEMYENGNLIGTSPLALRNKVHKTTFIELLKKLIKTIF